MTTTVAHPTVTVGSVLVRIEAGRSVKTLERPAEPGELGILRVSAVTWGEFDPAENKAALPDYEPGGCPRPMKGDILISRANTTELVGAAVQVPRDFPELLLSDKILRLVPDETKVDARYLLRVLQSPPTRCHFAKRAGGTSGSMQNITQDDIRSAPLPMPPLPEQRRIADILDKADAVRRKRKEAIGLTEELLRSAFLEMFGDPVTNPKGWETRTIGELTDRGASLVDGPFGSNLKPEHYVNDGVRVIRNYNINDDYFDPSQFKYVTPEKFEEIRRSEVRPGDVLITTKGTVGDVCLMPELGGLAVLSATGTARLRLPEGYPILGEFVVSQMTQPAYKRYIHTFEAGSAQQYLNLSGVRKMVLIVPPERKQHAFCQLKLKARKLRERMEQAAVESGRFFSSLVHRAFRGELTLGTKPNKTQLEMFT